MTLRQDVEFLFRPPEVDLKAAMRAFGPDGVGESSVLYQLRREAQGCMLARGIPLNDADFLAKIRVERNCLFAFLMVVFSGFDLLSKFADGSGTSMVGPRFKAFLTNHGGVGASDADRIYDLRNGLMHSFGVFNQKPKSHQGVHIPLDETCSPNCPDTGSLVFSSGSDEIVCLLHVWKTFIVSLNDYHIKLLDDIDKNRGVLGPKFENVFPDYGYLRFNPNEIGKGK